MAEVFDGGQRKRRGRPPGAPNKITRDIRAALRDLAEGNADRVQAWLDVVAGTDPAKALGLWLSLLRYVTPTLQAAAIADLSPRSTQARLMSMTNEELMEVIIKSPEAKKLVTQGVKTRRDLLLGMIKGPQATVLRQSAGTEPIPETPSPVPHDEELLR